MNHICKTSYRIKTLKFDEDSAVKTIYGNAFDNSIIEEIYFPASLIELKEGWCRNTSKLTKITISPYNAEFKIQENKYLLGKTDSNKDEFDVLLFAFRNIHEVSIPSNIKIISSCAFENCKYITKFEIPLNSNLQTIESNAFTNSNIKEIFIPSKVSKICKEAFTCCLNLTKVEITENSNLQIIESEAFSSSKISEIYFPTSLKELKEGWCSDTENLTKIMISLSNGQFIFKDNKYLIGKSDQNKDEFDILLFGCRDIKEISIPSNIKIISSYAFEYCHNLTKVEIPTNSNLQTIGKSAFAFSNIKDVFIPSNVSKICEFGFYYCKNLQIIEIAEDSSLISFPLSVFGGNVNLIIMIPPAE